MKTKSLLTAAFFLLTFQTQAQSELYVDPDISAEQMVEDFFNGICIDISNVSYGGNLSSKAYFEGANTDLGIPGGILMSTGNAIAAIGPVNPNASSAMGGGGDDDLEAIFNVNTNDAVTLEFDLVSDITDTMYFSYVFASEEYLEWVGQYNDVFAFFVEGAGYDSMTNIALLPDGETLVSINTVNHLTNTMYFIDYQGLNGYHLKYDGMTVELSAPFVVQANESYHIKIAIADANDQIFDSAVFLGVESLCGDSLITPPAEVQFSIDGNTISMLNESRYATDYLWDFGDNTTSTERYPGPHTYAQDGYYSVSLITQNYCCSDTFLMTIPVGNVLAVDANACDVGSFGLNAISPDAGQEGLWSVILGDGVLSDASDPNSVLNNPSIGINVLEWTITETSSGNQIYVDTFVLNINELPQVSITTDLVSFCENDVPVQLEGSPIGGLFEGVGVVGDFFDPAVAGLGNHIISYSFTDNNGCINSAFNDTEIIAVPATPEIVLIGGDSLYCSVTGDNYLWELDDNPLNSNAQQIEMAGDGNYTVTVIQSGCTSEPSEAFLFTGISTIFKSKTNKLNIFPNPAKETIQIQLSERQLIQNPESVKIFNSQGQIVSEFHWSPQNTNMQADVSKLPSGVYFIQVINSEAYYSGNFVKQ